MVFCQNIWKALVWHVVVSIHAGEFSSQQACLILGNTHLLTFSPMGKHTRVAMFLHDPHLPNPAEWPRDGHMTHTDLSFLPMIFS